MKAVGIKQLKARLSEYVRLARAGELILVSDRDEIVAQLGPAQHLPPTGDGIDQVLDRLVREGQITRARQVKGASDWSPRPLGLPRDTVSRLLEDLRSDR
jgi:antitoxin (DNA-binding transcriptional repressor) of toxin-antitoxin stability system